MGFDIQVEDGSSSTEAETTQSANDEAAAPPFEANETADFYLSFGDWKAVVSRIREAFDLEALKIYSEDTLEDAGRLLGEHNEAHDLQKLEMLAALSKSTFGKMQGNNNSHAIGLREGKAPDEDFESGASYAFHFRNLPTIEWDDLDGGEREDLEDHGIDPSELGFDPQHGGPKLPMIDGERVPIVANGDDGTISRLIEQFNNMADSFSYYDEDEGLVAGESSEKGGEAEASEAGEVDLAANPERITEVSVSDIKGGANNVSEITNLRAIKSMLSAESDSDNTRSSVIKRLKQRRNALQSSSDDESDEESGEAEGEPSFEEIRQQFGFSDLEMDAVKFRVESGKADSRSEAAQQVAN